jgi:hypothetical protein
VAAEVHFQLPDAALTAHLWRLAGGDPSQPHPPLIAGLYVDVINGPAGEKGVPRAVAVGGNLYLRANAEALANLANLGDAGHAAGRLDRWRAEWLPQVERLTAGMRDLDLDDAAGRSSEALRSHIEAWATIASGVRTAVVEPAERDAADLVDAFVAHHGEQRRDDARALLEGFPSRRSGRAIAVWELSRLLRSEGSRLSRTFGPTDGQRDYVRQHARTLEEYGDTTDGWRQDVPTWREDPSMLTECIREAAAWPDEASPAAAEQRRRERRATIEAELGAAAARDEAAARICEMLPAAQQRALVLDARDAACEQLVAASRAMWLAVGRHLAERDLLSEVGDVFYLERLEVLAALDDGPAPAAADLALRRVRRAAFAAATPPLVLGAAGEA